MNKAKHVPHGVYVGDLWTEDHCKEFIEILMSEGKSVDECWEWPKTKSSGGYGLFQRNYYRMTTHRASLELSLGRAVEGLVLHSCDNPPCSNPSHLREGSHSDNQKDVQIRNRRPISSSIGKVGVDSINATLTESQVLAIRELNLNGQSTYLIAQATNKSESTIRKIVSRKIWKHI